MHAPHGGNVYKYGAHVKDFSININILAPPVPDVVLKEAFKHVGKYPDPYYNRLRMKIAAYLNKHIKVHEDKFETVPVIRDNIAVGAGAIDLIGAFSSVFVRNGTGIVPYPTFTEYRWSIIRNGGKEAAVFRNGKEFKTDFDEILDICKKFKDNRCAVFLCCPNNPDGNMPDPDAVKDFISEAGDLNVNVMIDASFIEFTPYSGIFSGWVNRFANLSVIRTFTKFFGVPGLRVGYIISNPENIRKIFGFMRLWPVGTPESLIAEYLLNISGLYRRTVEYYRKERSRVTRPLVKAGFSVVPSCANYLLISSEKLGLKAVEIKDRLLEKYGILIRDCSDYPGLGDHYFRIGLKDPDSNNEAVNGLIEAVTIP